MTDAEKLKSLKPCPFCGSNAAVIEKDVEKKYFSIAKLPERAQFVREEEKRCIHITRSGKLLETSRKCYIYTVYFCTVTCSDTSCMAHTTGRMMASLDDAVERWNRRA